MNVDEYAGQGLGLKPPRYLRRPLPNERLQIQAVLMREAKPMLRARPRKGDL